MSNATLLPNSGNLPPVVPLQFTEDLGVAVPVANNLNVFGGTGINTSGAGDTITINLANSGTTTTQTIGAVTSEVTVINLGAIPSVGVFVARIVGFDSASNDGVAFVLTAAAKTDGAAASLVSLQDKLVFKDTSLLASDANVTVNGNSVTITVLGVAATTIDWVIETNFTAS